VLQQFGGVYLDIDTFIIRPFAPLSLYSYDTVLGMEARTLNFLRGPNSDQEMDPKGLCNAVIISRPRSTFLQRWLNSYEAFDEKKWAEHSVVSVGGKLGEYAC
jgi:mannosyltransferase OCH1-like enzyme